MKLLALVTVCVVGIGPFLVSATKIRGVRQSQAQYQQQLNEQQLILPRNLWDTGRAFDNQVFDPLLTPKKDPLIVDPKGTPQTPLTGSKKCRATIAEGDLLSPICAPSIAPSQFAKKATFLPISPIAPIVPLPIVPPPIIAPPIPFLTVSPIAPPVLAPPLLAPTMPPMTFLPVSPIPFLPVSAVTPSPIVVSEPPVTFTQPTNIFTDSPVVPFAVPSPVVAVPFTASPVTVATFLPVSPPAVISPFTPSPTTVTTPLTASPIAATIPSTPPPVAGTIPFTASPTTGTVTSTPPPTTGTIPSTSPPTTGTIPSTPPPTTGTIPSIPPPTTGTIPSTPPPTTGTIPSTPPPTDATIPFTASPTSGTPVIGSWAPATSRPTSEPTIAQTTAEPTQVLLTDSPSTLPTTTESSVTSSFPSTDTPSTLPTATESSETSSFPSTDTPSTLPTATESSETSSIPSTLFPTTNMTPSLQIFDTVTDTNGGEVTTCKNTNITLDNPVVLTYQYLLQIDRNSSIDTILPAVEAKSHKLLAFHLLTCPSSSKSTRRALAVSNITSISSLPKDTVATTSACTAEQQQSGTDCFIILGGFTPASLDASDLYSTIGDFLGNSTQVASISRDVDGVNQFKFLGFINTQDGTTVEQPPAAAAQETRTAAPSSPALIGGSVAIAVAVLGLLIVGALVLKQRKVRDSVYLKQHESDDVYSVDAPTASDDSRKAAPAVVWNDKQEEEEQSVGRDDVYLYEEEHNAATCISTTCRKCQDMKLQYPTFIKAELLQEEIQRDLGPKTRTINQHPREYYSPNTVDL